MGFYSHEEELPFEAYGTRSTPYLSNCGEVVLLNIIELTDSFLEKGIAVMGFSARHPMHQIGSLYNILHKLQISYVTEACVTTMQGAKNTGEVWAVYIKLITCHLHHFGTIKVDQVK